MYIKKIIKKKKKLVRDRKFDSRSTHGDFLDEKHSFDEKTRGEDRNLDVKRQLKHLDLFFIFYIFVVVGKLRVDMVFIYLSYYL